MPANSMTNDPLEPSRETKKQYGDGRRGSKTPALPKWTPDFGDDAPTFVDYLNDVWPELGTDPLTGSVRYGKNGDAAIELLRRSGARIRWPQQDALHTAVGLQSVMTQEAGVRPRKMSALDAMTIGWAIVRLSTLQADVHPHDEIVAWWDKYVESRKAKEGDPTDTEWRLLLAELQSARAFDEYRKPDEPRRTFIVVDARDGVRYVSRNDFAMHVRSMHRGSLSWPALNSRLAEVGWQQTRFQQRPTMAGAPYLDARLYVVPADWPEPDPDTAQGALDV